VTEEESGEEEKEDQQENGEQGGGEPGTNDEQEQHPTKRSRRGTRSQAVTQPQNTEQEGIYAEGSAQAGQGQQNQDGAAEQSDAIAMTQHTSFTNAIPGVGGSGAPGNTNIGKFVLML
jgi:hypothetical protein